MPRQVLGRVAVTVDLAERNTGVGTGSAIAQMAHAAAVEALIASGTSEGQMDRVHSDAITVTTTPTDVDLAGSLSSEIGGGTTTFARVNLVYVRNKSPSGSGNVQIGGDTNALLIFGAAADFLILPPGGTFLWYSPVGVAVTAGTGDILQLAASTGSVELEYIVGGRSA